ncbi:MAG: patatin-like phospholipase family protein [Burkholderiales bacterium]
MTALVLCGGGSRGALEVGFYRAVCELGLPVDLVVGSSIGALNGAFIAAGTPPGELARLWLQVRRRDVMHWNWKGLVLPRRDPGLYTLDPLREFLRRTLPATRFEDLSLPLTITTVDLQLGKAVYWSGRGDLVEPLIASLSLPGFFPPVRIGDHQFVDGGVANNVPLDQAAALGVRHALMIECVCCQSIPAPFAGVLGVLARSLSIAFDSKYSTDREHVGKSMQLHVVRPQLQLDVGLLDFRRTAHLIDAGYRQTLDYFRALSAPEISLLLPRQLRYQAGRSTPGTCHASCPSFPASGA